MKRHHLARPPALAASALGLLAARRACAASGTVAFLMPDQGSTRYEQHDFPGFKAEMEKLCPDCKVIYQNANADVALQQQQFNSVITQGAKVIVLDPVELHGRRLAGRSWPRARASRSSPMTGRSRTCRPTTTSPSTTRASARRSPTVARRAPRRRRASPRRRGVLQINGSPTDAAAGLIRDGVHEGLDASGYKTLAEFDTPDWAPPKAQEWASGQITALRRARSSASSPPTTAPAAARSRRFKAAGVDPVPPVTGNDATIAGAAADHLGRPVQHDLQALARSSRPPPPTSPCSSSTGETPEPKTTLYNTPSELFVPAVVTAREPQGRDHRQGDQHRRRDLHRPLCRRLRRARHQVSRRSVARPRFAPAGAHVDPNQEDMPA